MSDDDKLKQLQVKVKLEYRNIEHNNGDYWNGARSRLREVMAWIDEVLPDEPLPCPFCGCVNVGTETMFCQHRVFCPNCSAVSGLYATRDFAIDGWNKRT